MMGTPKWLEIASPKQVHITTTATLSISTVQQDHLGSPVFGTESHVPFLLVLSSLIVSWTAAVVLFGIQYGHNSQTFWYALAHKCHNVPD
jgi:hypothetical protein